MFVAENENAIVTFESKGQKIQMDITNVGGELSIKVKAENPDNLKEQRGFHVMLANTFFEALNE